MASRRMFSLKVIDTDHFFALPATARLLYYDLGMRADDDGFIGSPLKIVRMVGATPADHAALVSAGFLVHFESGVDAIAHWTENNKIQADRYHPTIYQAEKSSISGKIDMDPNRIHIGYKLDPQVRLGKVRLGKVRLEKKRASAPDQLPQVLQIPPQLENNTEFLTQWEKYISRRRQKRKSTRPEWSAALLKHFTDFTPAEVITALRDSNLHDWTGVFPKRQNQPQSNAKSEAQKAAANIRARFQTKDAKS